MIVFPIMSGIVHHIVRRGIEETNQRFQKGPEDGNSISISAWGAAILLATVVTYGAVMFAVCIPVLGHCSRIVLTLTL